MCDDVRARTKEQDLKRPHYALWALFALLLSSGCNSSTLLTGLNQRDANEIYVALEQAGIPVQIVAVGKGEEASSSVVVPSSEESRARLILSDHDLPRGDEYEQLLEMLKKTNLLSTEEENREIFRRTREWELAQKIRDLPSVISASVSLTLPRVDPLQMLAGGAGAPRPTATVAVKYWRPGTAGNPGDVLRPAVIQNLISGGVEKMLPEDVKITMTAVAPHEVIAPVKKDTRLVFVVYSVVIVALVGALLAMLMRNRSLQQQLVALEDELDGADLAPATEGGSGPSASAPPAGPTSSAPSGAAGIPV